MGEFSFTHLLLIGLIVLIFFGPTRLPALGQSLGKAIRGFKQGLHEIDAEAKPVAEANPQQLKNNTQPNTMLQNQTTTEKEKEKV